MPSEKAAQEFRLGSAKLRATRKICPLEANLFWFNEGIWPEMVDLFLKYHVYY